MKKWIIGAIVIIILVVLIVLGIKAAKKNAAEAAATSQGQLATCIKDSGAKFYGASWCPHCLAQKAMFKLAYKLLPYVECSPQQGTLLPVCEAVKIESFPTWYFAKGITITTTDAPTICHVPRLETDSTEACARQSENFPTWILKTAEGSTVIQSTTEPKVTGKVYSFDKDARAVGGLTFNELATQTSCPIPSELESIKDKTPEEIN